ncbi:MAG TPA: 16S rRNA (cytidine(1402)-2'-O)-methyltransferase [Methylomirabilota bacterium]|nr:16S rRNA (cytidine(1402)-2'-O)-methyltransferase [Methylomirabilota bacterium]
MSPAVPPVGPPEGKPIGYSIASHRFPAPALEPGLYPVATPIGNLGDVTLRALEVLGGADLIVCEDTRVTRTLLDRYAITRPLTAYHDHNAGRERPRLLAMLAGGMKIALVSDAGTPLVSDPGYKLVEEALAQGTRVIPIPGPSAILAALVAAGLPTDAFLFLGFLPPKSAARRARLAAFATVPATLVFYEAPHRAAETLADMAAVLGPDRMGALARELTKRFEEVRRGALADLAAGAAETPPRGEVVLLAGPPGEIAADADDLDALLRAALAGAGPGQAAAEVAKATGRLRREVYARALELKPAVDAAANAPDEQPE